MKYAIEILIQIEKLITYFVKLSSIKFTLDNVSSFNISYSCEGGPAMK